MYKKDIYGILAIPADFSKNVARGEQAHVSLYCDMGALLNYKALLTAGTDVSLAMGKDIQVQGMEYATEITEQITSSPVRIQDVKLFNPQGGFTSFLIPAVLILVVQQSLLLGVGTITGTERDRRRKGLLLPANKHFRRPARVVLGKAFAYLFRDELLGVFHRASFVRDDPGGGTGGTDVVFVPVFAGVYLFCYCYVVF